MVVLEKKELLMCEEDGLISIAGRAGFGAVSLDVHLDKLYKQRRIETQNKKLDELSDEEYLEEAFEEVSLASDEGVVVTPNDFYLFRPREEVSLAKNFIGEITSRSSWARLGVRVASVSESLEDYSKVTTDNPLCSLITQGTSVRIRKGDGVGQLFIKYSRMPGFILREDTNRLIDSQELLIERDGRVLRSSDLEYEGGLVLTMDSEIWLYTGGVINPGEELDEHFVKIDLNSFEDVYLRRKAFFISSSQEKVSIPEDFVGYVTESDSIMSLSKKELPISFLTHANAPYISPKNIFNGHITFENTMKWGSVIRKGIKQSEFYLIGLSSPSTSLEASRYNNQFKATKSRL
ncbi:hypothetical protein GOV05_03835 [Candidatus Woesearchaeota archaeon]|nr:hypothetical protein [Candidatus Woesearchaeota archaeon]